MHKAFSWDLQHGTMSLCFSVDAARGTVGWGGHILDREASVTTLAWALLQSATLPLSPRLYFLASVSPTAKYRLDEAVFNIPSSVLQTFGDSITHMNVFLWSLHPRSTPIFQSVSYI